MNNENASCMTGLRETYSAATILTVHCLSYKYIVCT